MKLTLKRSHTKNVFLGNDGYSSLGYGYGKYTPQKGEIYLIIKKAKICGSQKDLIEFDKKVMEMAAISQRALEQFVLETLECTDQTSEKLNHLKKHELVDGCWSTKDWSEDEIKTMQEETDLAVGEEF